MSMTLVKHHPYPMLAKAASQIPAPVPSCKRILEVLNATKTKYKELKDSHRVELYALLQNCAETATHLRANPRALESFLKQIGEDTTDNILLAVVSYVMNARSIGARKLASKRSRALHHLLTEHRVSPTRTAAAIPEYGGLEKLAREAALFAAAATSGQEKDQGEPPATLPFPEEPALTFELKMSKRMQAKLRSISPGNKAKLIFKIEAAADVAKLHVSKVTMLRSKPTESPEDWSD